MSHNHGDTSLTVIIVVRNRLQLLTSTHSCCMAFLVIDAFPITGPALVSFLTAMIKHPDKKQLKGEGGSRVQSIMMGKAWLQEYEAAGHTASTVRKQREMEAGAQLTFSILFHSSSSAYGMVPPTSHNCLPSS